MFAESATWIRQTLESINLPAGATVLDAGSSTKRYRTIEQPHVQRDVIGPLEARGASVLHLDAKHDPGVDVVCDIDAPNLDLVETLGHRFDLVLCANLLGCVKDPMHLVSVIGETVADGGYLLASTPESYRRTIDPYDNMIRPTPQELAEMFGVGRDFEIVQATTIRANSRRYYRGLRSRPMWLPALGRFWVPLPGFFETFRYLFPALRWKESCVLLRKCPPET